MNEQITQPPLEQPVITPVEPKSAEPQISNPKRGIPKSVIVAAVALIIIIAAVTIARVLSQRNVATPVPTPTPIPPTPTPIRILSKFATESAFTSLEASVASLSAVIAGYPITDPSLTPPTLVLPLQF